MRSDDGFTIGQFTASGTLNLLVVATVFGALGAAVYTVLRPLLIGPRWFQVLSISLGPAVVVGEQLVHVDGVDFTLLSPAWLAIVLFMAIPGVYAGSLTLLAERWRPPRGPFARAPWPAALVPLVAYGPVAPLLVALAGAWLVLEAVRRRFGSVPWAAPAAWAGRAALTVVFVVALVRLLDEAGQLVG
ncbi:MAG: hypothetical protein ACI379_03510 [Nocardioides sp.]|uniref:hypothetical protein n=1 Tax=Nocardioides sp. TaxID=35761 RepID=UPI003F0708D3